LISKTEEARLTSDISTIHKLNGEQLCVALLQISDVGLLIADLFETSTKRRRRKIHTKSAL